MSEHRTFLSPDEIAELTGIRGGKKGYTREDLQAQQLVKMRIPHYVNHGNRVVVVRAIIEGRSAEPPPRKRWVPNPA